MTPQIYREYSKILEKIAENLDITTTQYEEAKSKYEAVGKWLEDDLSPLKRFRPKISPQGSFRLGTVIKPLFEHEEYDVDLTCKLHIVKNSITQQLLKKMVGNRLKENENYKRMLGPEKRRCWRLHYAEDTQFHLDIVPSIPDDQIVIKLLESKSVPSNIAQHALCITDKETWNYDRDFPKSNPEGYAIWFTNQMKQEFEKKKQLLAEGLKMKMDEIPEYKIKTTLQRVVQLLKRHRDIRYQKDEDKPISIILTTLAAKVYNNETDIYEALKNILSKMDSAIEKDIEGNFQIKNPVNPDENFADKWNKNERKAELFFEWLEVAKKDFNSLDGKNFIELSESLKPVFGEKVVIKSYKEIAEKSKIERENGNLFMTVGTGVLSVGSKQNTIKVPNHTNFGN